MSYERLAYLQAELYADTTVRLEYKDGCFVATSSDAEGRELQQATSSHILDALIDLNTAVRERP